MEEYDDLDNKEVRELIQLANTRVGLGFDQ